MNWNTIDWVDLVLRWFHVMAGISWIGGSLYLMWLDRVFANPDRTARGERGEPWLIDLAGSLLVDKLKLGPGGLRKTHVWFKRETTLTYVSGLLLLVMVALLPGGSLLTDASGAPMGALAGTGLVVATLVLSWACYDFLWRKASSRYPVAMAAASYAIFVAASWGLTQLFSGRAAFILVGATLGSLLMGNVWFRLLPALSEMEEARNEGRPADVEICTRARERSAHNSYLIFPTVMLMLSNHYPVIHSHRFSWIALSLLAVTLVGVRHLIMNGRPGVWALGPAFAALAAAVILIAAIHPLPRPAGANTVSFATARNIVMRRCLSCHSAVPSDRTFGPSPGGVAFDTPAAIRRYAQRIKARAVATRTMPVRIESGKPVPSGSGMTATERRLLGRWVDEGARLD
jgi:uncharacterized membrane protein